MTAPSKAAREHPGRVRELLRAWRSEDGFESVEATIVFPIAILLIFAVIQGGIVFHARNTALHIATSSAQAARSDGALDQDAENRAAALLSPQNEGSILRDSAVVVSRTPTTVTVTITGTAPSLVPFFDGWKVQQTATFSLEQWAAGGGTP